MRLCIQVCAFASGRMREWPVEDILCHFIKSILNRWAINSLFWRTKEGVNQYFFHIKVCFCEVTLLFRDTTERIKCIPASKYINFVCDTKQRYLESMVLLPELIKQKSQKLYGTYWFSIKSLINRIYTSMKQTLRWLISSHVSQEELCTYPYEIAQNLTAHMMKFRERISRNMRYINRLYK